MMLLARPVLDYPSELIKRGSARKKGHDAKTLLSRVHKLNGEINALLEQRQKVAVPLERAAEFAAQGNVLRDVQNYENLQFAETYMTAKRKWADKNIETLDSLGMASTGGFLGALMAYIAVSRSHPVDNGPAGIGFIVSGAILTVDPALRKLGEWQSAHASKKATKDLLSAGIDISKRAKSEMAKKLANDLDTLEQIRAAQCPGASPNTVLAVMKAEKKFLSEEKNMKESDAKQRRIDFINRFLRDDTVGGTKMAWGIKLAESGFAWLNQPKAAFTSIAQGATVFTVGTGYQVLDVLGTRVAGEISNQSKKKKGQTPKQLLKKRLSELDVADAMLKP